MDTLDNRIRVIESKPYDNPVTGRRLWVRLAGPSAAPKPKNGIVTGSVFEEVDTGRVYKFDEGVSNWHKAVGTGVAPKAGEYWRVSELLGSNLAAATIIEAVGIPQYVSDVSDYSSYGLTETGWYVFARIAAEYGTTVTAGTTVTGAAGYIANVGDDHVDVAVRFEVAAQSQEVTIDWGTTEETYVFKATDLGISNLDYRTTFYLYDLDEYVTWSWALTTDATFAADKNYYTLDNGVYTLATVTAGEAVPEDTYYTHSKVTFSGMTKNVTYKFDQIIDCPIEIALPVITDAGYGAWFEIQLRYNGSYSCTLLPPEGVKIGTVSTQAQTAGINVLDLQYTGVGGVQMWSLLNTHSNIPS